MSLKEALGIPGNVCNSESDCLTQESQDLEQLRVVMGALDSCYAPTQHMLTMRKPYHCAQIPSKEDDSDN
jgi:hypothetical protein